MINFIKERVNRYGLVSAIKRILVIFLYTGISAVATYLGTVVTNWKPDTAEFVMVQMAVNAGLGFIQKWLSTKAPVEIG